jgi:hypothetical protein
MELMHRPDYSPAIVGRRAAMRRAAQEFNYP